ncbi:YciI family protein [Dokdonella ginsengisoli]|uniref:YciI family protein n=1 Tax=Dokdonella ginsengisoli TaxID=363846 RepID=A0ABV9QYU8_9GAMM
MNRYLVLVMRKPAFDPSLGPAHQAFLDELRAQGRLELSGPFADASGGAYLMRAPSLDAARADALRDPLHRHGSSTVTVHEWRAA